MANFEDGHTCRECGKSYNKKWRLEEHKRSHTGERPYKCEFDGCGKSFIRPYHLKRHLLIHTGQESFKCSYPDCTKTFCSKHSLKRHEKRSHDKPFKCQYEGCSESFKKSIQLRRHTCVHTNEKLFNCQVEGCEAGFVSLSKLQRHMKKHNKGYVCSAPGCSAAFDKFSKLSVHMRSHGFACNVCEKSFSEVWELKKHVTTHSTNRKLYECPKEGCSRVYTKAFNLRVHIKAFHEGHRPYQCTWEGCSKGFAHRHSLKQHLMLHSQRRIKPIPSPQDRSPPKKKKKKKPVSLAKQLSGYRSSLSESSETHCTETVSKKRKPLSSQSKRDETERATDTSAVESNVSPNLKAQQGGDGTSSSLNGVTESTNVTSAPSTLRNEDNTEIMTGVVASASTPMPASPCNDAVKNPETQDRPNEVEGQIATDDSSAFVFSCNNSATPALVNNRPEVMQVEVALTSLSNNFHEQNAKTLMDEDVIPSPDESREFMEWEPADCENSGVNSPAACNPVPENVFEDVASDICGSQEPLEAENGLSYQGSSSEQVQGNSISLPIRINAEIVSTVLSAVSVNGIVDQVETRGTKRSVNKEGEGIKKSNIPSSMISERNNTEASSSASKETASVSQLEPPLVGLEHFCNDGGSVRAESAVSSADFPYMGDVLQVIVAAEENERDSRQHEVSTRAESVGGDIIEKCAEAQMTSPSKTDLDVPHESQEKNNDAGERLVDGKDMLNDSFNDVSHCYEDVDSDEEDIVLSELVKRLRDSSCSPSKEQVTRDTEHNKQSCSSSATRDTSKIDESRVLIRDPGHSESEVTGNGKSQRVKRSQVDLARKINMDDSKPDKNTDEGVPKTLFQPPSKSSNQKSKSNVCAKPTPKTSTSCTPTKPSASSRGNSQKKSGAHSVNQASGNNLKVDGHVPETDTNSGIATNARDEYDEDVSKAKCRSNQLIFSFDLKTLELLWNFKGK